MGKLYFRYGAMGSGKTAALLQVAYNYDQKNIKAIVIKPSIDTKGQDKIVSRIGIERKVDVILTPTDKIIEKIQSINTLKAIIIDEAQFLTRAQVNELYMITKTNDISILCYGLRCDFQMNGFEGSTRLLEIADDIEELKTICKCGAKATQNLRLVNGIPIFHISLRQIGVIFAEGKKSEGPSLWRVTESWIHGRN